MRALGALQRRHPLLRARIEVVDSEPAFVEVAGAIPLTVLTLGEGESPPIPSLMECTFEPPPCPVARCVYLPVEGEDRSSLVLVVHHAMAGHEPPAAIDAAWWTTAAPAGRACSRPRVPLPRGTSRTARGHELLQHGPARPVDDGGAGGTRL